MRLLGASLSLLLSIAAMVPGSSFALTPSASVSVHSAAPSRPVQPAAKLHSDVRVPTQGDELKIICRLNADRQRRRLPPVFLHRTLSQVAFELGTRYADGSFSSSDFNSLMTSKIFPLGNSVSTSYKIIGTVYSDNEYIANLETSIYGSLFSGDLDAIGLYEDRGIYTIVLASGLSAKPASVEACPVTREQFVPPTIPVSTAPALDVVNGVDLPRFLCSINKERIAAGASPLAVHSALASEATEQARIMSILGKYTVDGPRHVDEAIYAQRVNISKLGWIAGDSFSSVDSLVNLLVATYGNQVLDPTFNVVGVAQNDRFWSVILGKVGRSVAVGKTCPKDINEVTFTS